jgi:hypothetical protein
LIGNAQQTPDQLLRGDDIMNRKTHFALLAVFLGASLIAFASGSVNRVSVTETSGVQAAPAQPAAVPYFPAQYVLKAGPGTSEPFSTF